MEGNAGTKMPFSWLCDNRVYLEDLRNKDRSV